MVSNLMEKTLAPLLRKSLTAYSTRHTAIGENIANVETKGFRPLKVDFEAEFRRALEKNGPVGQKTNHRHLDIGHTVDSLHGRIKETDAQVNIEQEMADLARNQIRFDFAVRKLRGGYDNIKMAIRGRVG